MTKHQSHCIRMFRLWETSKELPDPASQERRKTTFTEHQLDMVLTGYWLLYPPKKSIEEKQLEEDDKRNQI